MDDILDNLGPEHVPASALPFVKSGPLSIKEFGEWLKALREEKGLTLTQLGDSIGYSNPYLSQIETGKKKSMPSPELLKKLAKPLGIQYSHLLRMAGYEDLAKGVQLRELQEDFDDLELDKIKEQEKFIEAITDLKNLLEREVTPYPKYNGHRLTAKDRHRILDMLKTLFPEYHESSK